MKAVKQAVNHNWKNPRTVPKLLGVMRNNVEIGQKQGELSGKDLISYAFFAYGLPAGNFVQVKIGGITGTNELHTDPSNIQAAVQEFLHPDVQAPEKATAAATGRKLRSKNGPSPRSVSIVVLNGNGKPGAAANTSYLLGQKGYRMLGPPQGFQANAPGRWESTFRTQIFYTARPKARRAAQRVSALFNSSEIRPMPKHNSALQVLRNGAMLLVVVGQTFSGELTPTPVDRTPPKEPPSIRPGKSDMLPVVRAAAAWKVGFPLQIPTVLERTSALSTEVPYRVYKLDKGKTVRFTFAKSGQRVLGHPGDELERCPRARGQEPQPGDPGPPVRPLLQRAAPAHGRAQGRRRELLGREHAPRLDVERDDARDRQGPAPAPQVDLPA